MATGQILRNFDGKLKRDGDGKLKLWAPAPVNTWQESDVQSQWPDRNYGNDAAWGCFAGSPSAYLGYAFIRGPMPGAGTLWLYAQHSSPAGGADAIRAVDVWEVAEDWDEWTITWNNMPALGNKLIDEQPHSGHNVWDEYALTNSEYGYMFAMQISTTESRGRHWWSHTYEQDEGLRPYWVED